ncbi:LysR family transcriptional regulator [Pseudoteredinibacter isoporae]|nr:LysR family transcriptional regulator [Pseudoteredinibacter isoporae]NIB22797.1 LysR family transcriptional regulator [Pseudoteredinibacter isoporae]
MSATAKDIGVHRSTVMRHIDALEESLGVVLFQRNDKGYLPTEAGLEIMRLGEVTDYQFANLMDDLQNKDKPLEGNLNITTVNEVIGSLLPIINRYQSLYPGMRINISCNLRSFNLKYGEADIAIRLGPKPETPDNVVIPLSNTEISFCAHESYIQKYGQPTKDNLHQHKFIALNERHDHLPWNDWVHNNIPTTSIILTSSSIQVLNQALLSGTGIGAMPKSLIQQNKALTEVVVDEHWEISIWMLVHRDLFHMPKIKKFIELLKQQEIQILHP